MVVADQRVTVRNSLRLILRTISIRDSYELRVEDFTVPSWVEGRLGGERSTFLEELEGMTLSVPTLLQHSNTGFASQL